MGGQTIQSRRRPAGRLRRAVSLVELIIVAMLVSILAMVAVPSGMNTSALAVDEAACRVQQDLAYAQGLALMLRSPQSVVCDPAQGFYFLAPAATPGAPLVDAVSHKAYRVFFRKACANATLKTMDRVASFPDVDLSAAGFDGHGTLTFNSLGLPINSGGNALADGAIEVAADGRRRSLTIDPVSGDSRVTDPAQAPPQQ